MQDIPFNLPALDWAGPIPGPLEFNLGRVRSSNNQVPPVAVPGTKLIK